MGPKHYLTVVFAQVANVSLEYVGQLDNDKFISLVDETLDSAQPCSAVQVAAGGDGQHSGVLTASGGNKLVTVPQASPLDADSTFAVCFATGDGSVSDSTWADSG